MIETVPRKTFASTFTPSRNKHSCIKSRFVTSKSVLLSVTSARTVCLLPLQISLTHRQISIKTSLRILYAYIRYCSHARESAILASFVNLGQTGRPSRSDSPLLNSMKQNLCYLVVAVLLPQEILAFLPVAHPFFRPSSSNLFLARERGDATTAKSRKRSKVTDPAGPTPQLESDEIEEIDPESVEELRDIRSQSELPHPVPHQPWRRGDTAGCEAPIAAEWRQEAEDLIIKAVAFVGGRVLDVTWFLTQLVVTIDEESMPPRDFLKAEGPVINVQDPSVPRFYDPDDPTPEDIWDDEEDFLYQRETEEEAANAETRRNNLYATKDADDDPDEPHNPDMADGDDAPRLRNVETRDEVAYGVALEEENRFEELEKPIDLDTLQLDKAALSTIANAILDVLGDAEEELQILSRHELILTSPGPVDVLETQRQFDAYRDKDVMVETQDPFNSNRTLKGKLVDRNAMDLIINKKGRMVTIPLNFVKCVRLPPHELNKEYDAGEIEAYEEELE